MSEYYNANRNAAWNYGGKNWKLSRSKIDLFLNCPRCFYLDNKLGIKRPPGFPFNLNSAVDTLLKKEFDIHRTANTPHPLMKAYGLVLAPFQHEMMDEWRDNFKGVRFLHQPTGLLVSGAVDDIWADEQARLYVVDYKSTAKAESITELDQAWQIGYKRQMEVYQWLLRQNGFQVSDTGYFVYCNGQTDREAFDAKLEFDINIIAYQGNDTWVEGILAEIKNCLNSQTIPVATPACDYCCYIKAVNEAQ